VYILIGIQSAKQANKEDNTMKDIENNELAKAIIHNRPHLIDQLQNYTFIHFELKPSGHVIDFELSDSSLHDFEIDDSVYSNSYITLESEIIVQAVNDRLKVRRFEG